MINFFKKVVGKDNVRGAYRCLRHFTITRRCVGRIGERSINNFPCHPELVSGSCHRQKCVTICTVSGKEVLDKVGWAFSPTMKLCWGKNPNIQKAISYGSRKATRHVRGGLVPAFTLAEVFLPYYHSPRKVAFTLAEVLITLGIIGVVAALTLPVIIPKIDKAITVNQLKKSFSTLYQLILLSEKDNGEVWEWESPDEYSYTFNESEFFKKYFEPYLKKVVDYKSNLPNVEYATYNIDGDRVPLARSWTILPDGSSIGLFNNSGGEDGSLPGGGTYMWIFIDVNNKQPPNRLGRDIFMAELVRNKRIVMWGSDYNNRNSLITDKYGYSCKKGTHERYAGGNCGALIQMDGWEIKDDYPW